MRRIFICLLGLHVHSAFADESAFTKGPLLTDFGPVADVKVTLAIPEGAVFRHSFDISSAASEGSLNRSLVSAARLLNMHARAGLPPKATQLAMVIHGKAVIDVSDELSPNAALVAALVEKDVRIIVCGQSAAYYDVATADLLPGVEMAVSAMTAHALLQQQGYTINPF